MNDRRVLPFVLAMKRPDPARLAEFAEIGRRLKEEREVSVDVVTSLLHETPRAAWPRLSERPELQNSGTLGQLAQEIEKRLDTNPREALALAELAVRISEALSAEEYPDVHLAQLRAHAWRDRGKALSYLGRYDEALRDMDRAEEELRVIGSLAHDEAVLSLCRAVVLQHMRRFDEAHALLDQCRNVFRGYADTQAYVKCTLAMGNLLVRKGDYRAAREILRELSLGNSPESEAIAHLALGWCAIHLSNAKEALDRFTESERLFQMLGRRIPTVRAAYGIGSALLRLGRLNEAIDQLQTVRAKFLVEQLVEEAGLSGLEIVEAYLLMNSIDAAKPLAATLVQEFTRAGLNRRAVAALAYLNEAVAASSATPDIVRNVHSYIYALSYDPTREFAGLN